MGIITLVVLGLTLLGMALGALFGFLRGRERALLRLVLVIISAVLAIALRGAVVDAIMNINIEGATLQESLISEFASGESSMPQGITNLIFVLIKIVVGFVAYFILLFSLRFITWILVFPFLKLVIRFFESKRAENARVDNMVENSEPVVESVSESVEPKAEDEFENVIAEDESIEAEAENCDENAESVVENEAENATEETAELSEEVEPAVEMACEDAEPVKTVSVRSAHKEARKQCRKINSKHRGQGALVGLAQGVLLAYFLFAPLTCLLTQINAIASFEINEKPLVEIPEEIGITEYTESAIGKFYNATGGWYYEIMTTATDANGNKVSLQSTLDTVSVILEVANAATSLENDLKILDDENATPQQKISAFNNLGDKLLSVGTSMEKIDEGTKTMIEDLVKEMGGADASQEEINEVIEMLTPEIFTQAGNAIKTYAEYEQVKLDGADLTQDQASNMVDTVHSAIDIVGEVQLDVNDSDKSTFKAAIDSKTDMSAEDKETLYKMFGIQAEETPDQ